MASVRTTSGVGGAAPPNHSPWLDELRHERVATPLAHDGETDVAIIGAGIAGLATSFFLLRETSHRVTVMEANRAARGATAYNAGQLVTYFERPICRIAEDFGVPKAVAGQRDLDASWGLFDLVVGESEFDHLTPRLVGHMGMFTLNHLMVHLRNNLLRKRGGLVREYIRISDRADFLGDISPEFAGLFEVVPQEMIHSILETDDPRYRATLSNRKGCVNSALLCEQLIEYLARTYGPRFTLHEHSPVERIELDEGRALVRASGHSVRAGRVVLCTNGFVAVEVENSAGPEIHVPVQVQGAVGFMAAYLEDRPRRVMANSYLVSPRIGEGQSYFYATRRPFRMGSTSRTLTCVGGPDALVPTGTTYDKDAAYPAEELAKLNEHVLPLLDRASKESPRYDYLWHGLMGYTPNQVRIIGADPRNGTLLYNLGCNGVGLLPSIHGAWRISQIIEGAQTEPSIFDPT